ncbi:MAG: DNA polymerase IV [Syntrophales bacterium]|jgi:DNA polymerase-4/DNA polymerase V|nr:DNA polymerase IV [Syntrophales bacterium]MDY0045172.1 DNA polymerase IV [Syntrophales bacterium]
MKQYIFSLHSWPRAILHVDGDAFFTSCEEAIHPEFKGKPLITGGERGIVACANYVAKGIGIKRGVPLHEARTICPDLIVLPSDYETYSLFSRRMFSVIRRFTPQVEEYSIDEAFADITGMRRVLHSSYENIALAVKKNVEKEVGIGVTVGLSITKVLAKIASKYKKPDGFTVIDGRSIPSYLADLPVEAVWGIGHATSNYLWKLGVRSALDFARFPERTALRRFVKPVREIWQELRGNSVYPVITDEKSRYASISKTKTFAPSTTNRDYLFAQLTRNLESACIKARRHSLAAQKIAVFLKKNNFYCTGSEVSLNRPSALPLEFSSLLRKVFEAIYEAGTQYRATGVILLELIPDVGTQYCLFDDPLHLEKVERLYVAADSLAKKYGKHTIHLGGSHLVDRLGTGKRGESTVRHRTRFPGETERKHLGFPILHNSK